MSRAGKQWNRPLGGFPSCTGPGDASPGVLKKSLALAARLVLVSGLKPGSGTQALRATSARGGIFDANEENHRGNRGGVRFVFLGAVSSAQRIPKKPLY